MAALVSPVLQLNAAHISWHRIHKKPFSFILHIEFQADVCCVPQTWTAARTDSGFLQASHPSFEFPEIAQGTAAFCKRCPIWGLALEHLGVASENVTQVKSVVLAGVYLFGQANFR